MRSLRDAVLLVLLAAAPLAVPLAAVRPSFVRPEGLALFGLALPLVLLHMLRVKSTRRTIGSVLLWREVDRALDARHPFQRLRRNLPLFLQLLALAALAVALATPRFRGGGGSGRDCVIVIDASASMKTKDGPGNTTRFEVARSEARARVRSMRSGERACLIVATPRGARTAQGWTEDAAALDDALASLQATDGGADLGDALLLAAAAARPLGEQGEVLLLSDGGGPPLPALDWKGRLRYRAIGARDENLAIVGAERSEDERAASSVLVSVLNAGQAARRAWVELDAPDGKPLAARTVELPPRSRVPLVLEAELAPGVVTARVTPADGLPDLLAGDDEVPLIVPASREETVALMGSSRPLARALEAAHVRVVDHVTDDARLAVFAGSVPETLPPVACLIVDPPRDVGPVAVGAPIAGPRIEAWERDDRLLRFVSFADTEVRQARTLVLGPGARALVSSEATPLVVSWSDGDAVRVLVGFDLAQSSWPLRLSFPIFVRNCVAAALEDDAGGPRGVVRAGSVVRLRAVGPGLSVTTPGGRAVEVPVEDGRGLFGETLENGVYRVKTGGRESVFAVATLDENESRIAPRPVLEVGGEIVNGEAVPDAGEREVVAPFLLLALGALLIEGFAFFRRW